jgi:hypothetical protein
MIVGCYTLDLYCDGDPECPKSRCIKGSTQNYPPAQYTAENGADCRRQARRDGWILNMKEGTTVCRACALKGFKPGPST